MGHWLASLSIKELGPQYVSDVQLLIQIFINLDTGIYFNTCIGRPDIITTPMQQIHRNDLHVLRLI